jgi:cyclophilin family peptidyl-prolyl cis-trans isomerase
LFIKRKTIILKNRFKLLFIPLSLFISTFFIFVNSATATIVQFQTTMGDFQVNLYDKTTPETVKNFLAYVNAGAYNNTVITRAIPNFVVQGGGYKYDAKFPLVDLPSNAPIINEPVYSNRRGTIAMAKLSGNPNSATNEWFFNLKDNSEGSPKLDTTNGGYTVFGEVIFTGSVDGMLVLDAMAALNVPFTDKEQIPLVNYTPDDLAKKVPITDKNLVFLRGITVVKSGATDTDLNPKKNTLINEPVKNSSGGGGGSIECVSLLMLLGLAVFSRSRRW